MDNKLSGRLWIAVAFRRRPSFLLERSEVIEMMGVVVGTIMVVMVFHLYCCVRIGAMADQRIERLCRKEKQDADGESG